MRSQIQNAPPYTEPQIGLTSSLPAPDSVTIGKHTPEKSVTSPKDTTAIGEISALSGAPMYQQLPLSVHHRLAFIVLTGSPSAQKYTLIQ